LAVTSGQSLRGIFECALWLLRAPFKRSPAIQPKARQADLPRLDSVRVVRNDLTDSDFEVVPKKPQSKGTNPFSASRAQEAQMRKTDVVEPAEPVAASSD
jgi:hypothetical protein